MGYTAGDGTERKALLAYNPKQSNSPRLSIDMATVYIAKKAVTIAPTIRTLPSGVPVAPLLNLAARAPASSHHGHSHSPAGPRADTPPSWAGGVSRTQTGLVSKTYMTCTLSLSRGRNPFKQYGIYISQHHPIRTTNNVTSTLQLSGRMLMFPISQSTALPTSKPTVHSRTSWLEPWVSLVPRLPSLP